MSSGAKQYVRDLRSDDARKADEGVITYLVLHRDDAKHRWCIVERANDPLGPIVKWHAVAYQIDTALVIASAVAGALRKKPHAVDDWRRDDKTIEHIWAW